VIASRRVNLTGTIAVPVGPAQAFELFTPTGERRWAHGWDPRFPLEVADETTPGTVFQVDHDEPPTTWIVVACETGRHIAYARSTPDRWAGTVTVDVEPVRLGSCATVSYALTALTSDATGDLQRFAADYPHMLQCWQTAIEHALRHSR
jgi:hypothetical protein